jgi:hypothetical protein
VESEERVMASRAPKPEWTDGAGNLPPIVWIDEAELRRLFDRRVREELGISGDEFVARWQAGDYAEIWDDADHLRIGNLAAMIGLA